MEGFERSSSPKKAVQKDEKEEMCDELFGFFLYVRDISEISLN